MNDDVKDDETKAEYEVEQDLDIQSDGEEETAAPKRTKLGRGLVLGGFVVSVLLGGTLGVIGSKIFAGPDNTITLRAEFQRSLDELKRSTQSQTKRLGSAADSVQKRSTSRLDTLQTENQTLTNQVGTMEQTIARLQNNAAINLKTLTDRIAVLEALSGENADMFTGTDSITARLNALEESTFVAIADEVSTELPEDIISEDTSAVDTSDTTRISAKPPVDEAQQTALGNLIDTFPRAKMLAAVKAQEQAANKKIGWLKRALSKHIRVGNDNAPDPYVIIDTAEAALRDGQITEALEQLAQLNPPVRASAAEWVQAAKKTATSIE